MSVNAFGSVIFVASPIFLLFLGLVLIIFGILKKEKSVRTLGIVFFSIGFGICVLFGLIIWWVTYTGGV